ncbi:ras-related protein Rab-40B [Carlito syrichta]|uniref:small monomeric GTPase n=1 Tax=Carlito syrichta TaxID=1868482 RepID=A0A1U7T1T1_CARSF|nr:ras-related protein Rab-40B [Carlito syrichta]
MDSFLHIKEELEPHGIPSSCSFSTGTPCPYWVLLAGDLEGPTGPAPKHAVGLGLTLSTSLLDFYMNPMGDTELILPVVHAHVCSVAGPMSKPSLPSAGIDYKTTTILLDGRRVKLQLWDTSGQGRFCTIFRSYSRGAQGVILVYDIANRWSFDGIDRWIKEIDEHAPGVPKILVGNRLHLAFKRQVPTEQAQAYAERLGVTFFEVSPLCNFNITESFMELARIVLLRHGMDRLWKPSKVLSLQDLCCRAVVSCTPVHLVDKLPLPIALRSHLKSFSMANGLNARMMHGRSYSLTTSSTHKRSSLRKVKIARPPQSPPKNCTRNNCKIS